MYLSHLTYAKFIVTHSYELSLRCLWFVVHSVSVHFHLSQESSSWFSFSFLLFLLFFVFFRAKLAAISTGVAKRENELKETIIQLKSDQLKISVQVTKILTMMLTY